jgi:replication factor A1
MRINEMRPGIVKVNTLVIIKDKQPIREFELAGARRKVADCIAEDETGEIKVSLWDSDAETINTGDKIRITNGYVKEFNSELELSAGKFGRVDIVK